MKALSIRQPWAWLIAHGYKDVENRTWFSSYKGPLLIHAGKTMTHDDYQACLIFVNGLEIEPIMDFPSYKQLRAELGGIVGQAEMVGCVTESKSQWFVGDYGFLMRNALVLPFQPMKGALGFFDAEKEQTLL
jgi:hypothetical protein